MTNISNQLADEFYQDLKDVIRLIENNTITTSNFWENVWNYQQLSTHILERNYPYLLQVAIQENSLKTIDLLMNHFQVPENLSVKERLCYYQLLGD